MEREEGRGGGCVFWDFKSGEEARSERASEQVNAVFCSEQLIDVDEI
jgi:hypothetical protein